MNIFVLDNTPSEAAKMHCDKHVVKMILETAQLLSTAHHELDGSFAPVGLYRRTHKNHPCAIWVRTNRCNYMWTWNLLSALCQEYTGRYGRTHATETKLLDILRIPPVNVPNGDLTVPPQCMPDEYKNDDVVTAYRNYYKGAKKEIAQWNHSATPEWW